MSECGHGGTIHLGGACDGYEKCRLCGQVFDELGNPIEVTHA